MKLTRVFFLLAFLAITSCDRTKNNTRPTSTDLSGDDTSKTIQSSFTKTNTITYLASLVPTESPTLPSVPVLAESSVVKMIEFNAIVGDNPISFYPSQFFSISPNGETIAVIGPDWPNDYTYPFDISIENKVFLWTLNAPDDSVKSYVSLVINPQSIAFNHKGDLFAIAGSDMEGSNRKGKIAVVDWRDGEIIGLFNSDNLRNRSIRFQCR